MGTARQVCSLRIQPDLYAGLSRLARERRTTITAQLERAVRTYLQHAVAGDALPLLRPQLEAVISEELDAKVGARFRQMQERLAALLAKVAIDAGSVLYIALRQEQGDKELYDQARAWAARHVRERLADAVDVGSVAREELDGLRGQLQAEQAARVAAERALMEEQRARQAAEARAGQAERVADYHTAVLEWVQVREQWARGQYEAQGVLRRRSLETFQAEFERQNPPPRRPV